VTATIGTYRPKERLTPDNQLKKCQVDGGMSGSSAIQTAVLHMIDRRVHAPGGDQPRGPLVSHRFVALAVVHELSLG
jgi:hypothetical protein